MKSLKSFAPLAAYVAVVIGLFWARSAWIALLGFHAGLLLVLFIDKPTLSIRTLFNGFNFPLFIVCVLLSLSGGMILILAWPRLSISPNLTAQLAALGLTSRTWPAFIAYFAVVNPWLGGDFGR